ncbi:NAD(P)-dependent oxidoreductase [Telmatospirillum sp. J64-1]|uniref:NAD(P)-dependent oxidoreductase n=1 Tax=Telmatospirillum sp. J64-1 TaxID=2502183 RepID=UPI00115E4137|nr:NAD(P)-dependent oxidoreductase [Telmatospirillum sp. J64-1]
MKPTVSILAPGGMGAALAARLVQHGVEVRTSLTNRSERSAERARAAGMTIVNDADVLNVDFLLSVVPPKEALALAETLAPQLKQSDRRPIYVDLNAVNPDTAVQIAGVVEDSGTPFVDGSIIGLPPKEGSAGPSLYVSGEEARKLEALSEFGLQMRVLDAPVGAASALKMSYGGITKGLIALGSAMILGAERAGVGDALYEEMSRTQPGLLNGFSKSIPDMFSKAARWVAEMEEISEFLGEERPQGRMFKEIGALYSHLADDQAGDIATLARFFEQHSAKG